MMIKKHHYVRTLGYGAESVVVEVKYRSSENEIRDPIAVKVMRCYDEDTRKAVLKELLPLIAISKLGDEERKKHLPNLLYFMRVGK